MSLDVLKASSVAGGESHQPAPFVIDGLFVHPPTKTLCSQVTGDDSTVLRAGILGGRARLVDHVKDFAPAEVALVTTSGSQFDDGTGFAVGTSVWATAVAIQHRPAAAISIVWVLGAVALEAAAAKPTQAAIATAVGGSEQARYVILGDIEFYRSADTVINTRVDHGRRPAYVQEGNKTTAEGKSDDQAATMGLVYGGFVDFPATLASIYAASAGDLIANCQAPAWEHGGEVGQLEYLPGVAGAGASASIALRPNVTNLNETVIAADGDDLTLTLALSAIGQVPANTRAPGSYTTRPVFKPGAKLSVELQTKTTAFTGGSGTLRLNLWKYVPAGRAS
jgi:hypothetical protein